MIRRRTEETLWRPRDDASDMLALLTILVTLGAIAAWAAIAVLP